MNSDLANLNLTASSYLQKYKNKKLIKTVWDGRRDSKPILE